jgi:UTP-glucose-1-phosphate uridylyltransferase
MNRAMTGHAVFLSETDCKNEARQVAMYLIRELCDTSLKEIAQLLNLVRSAHNWNVGIMECWNNG